MSELETLRRSIAALENQRAILGSDTVDALIAAAQEKIAALSQADSALERRQLATILFADVSGFTALSEKLDVEDVQDVMRRLWQRLDQVILGHNGRIDKHIGDAVMAVWGGAEARENDAAQAVRAALFLQTELTAFRQAYTNVALAMRVGLNTGLVSISKLASTSEENIIGDTVNLASRLEHLAPVNGVLISQTTYDQVRGLFDVTSQKPVQVKGKQDRVQTYLVNNEKQRAFHMQTRGIAGIQTRLVGRDNELKALQTTFQQTLSEQIMRWVTISGGVGIGKSRLLNEFLNWVELQPEVVWLIKGRAWLETEHSPYYLLRDMLAFRFEIADTDAPDAAKQKLEGGLTAVLGQQLGEEAAAFIGQLIGLDYGQSRWIIHIQDDRQQIRGRAQVLLRAFLHRASAHSPVLVLLEDLHWADDESMAFLSEVWNQAEIGALCVIGIARPSLWSSEGHWGDSPIHQRIDLTPLTAVAAGQLIQELLQKIPAPPNWLTDLLISRSEGNPYFLEELVHWLIENEVILPSADQWSVNDASLDTLVVPATVQGVLQARLERLDQTGRSALQRAAVVGRAFWDNAVAYIGQETAPNSDWGGLQSRDLVYRQSESQLPDEEEYRFAHALLRDVVYEFTLKKDRRVFHRRAAEWLTQKVARRTAEWAPIIARHYEIAEMWQDAALWYGRAGQQARAAFAPQSGVAYYQKAFQLVKKLKSPIPTLGQSQLIWYQDLGEMLRWQARHEEAEKVFIAMKRLAERQTDPDAQIQANFHLLYAMELQGDTAAMLKYIQENEKLLAGQSNISHPTEKAKLLFWRSWIAYRQGDLDQAIALAEQLLTTKIADSIESIRVQIILGAVAFTRGDFDRADEHYLQALHHAQQYGNRHRAVMVMNNLGGSANGRGDFAQSRYWFEQALKLSRQIGIREGELMILTNIGEAQVELQQYQEAEVNLLQVLAMPEAKKWFGLGVVHLNLARAYQGQARYQDALTAAQKGLQLTQSLKMIDSVGLAWRILGSVLGSLAKEITIDGRVYDPRACFEKSQETFRQLGAEAEESRTWLAWADFERADGNLQQAEVLRQQAVKRFETLGLDLELARLNRET